jgi:stage V sporulation protein AA
VKVSHPLVYLQDIAELSCHDTELLDRLRVLPVTDFSPEKSGRAVFSVSEVIKKIQQKEPELNICVLGEANFIITYDCPGTPDKLKRIAKVVLVCLLSFFGAAFSIMTFNNDVDVPGLFAQIYTQVTGKSSSGFTILELSYSVGIGLGVLLFFNHFGKWKITSDPTPMQVKMRSYEDEVNTTIMEEVDRKDQS